MAHDTASIIPADNGHKKRNLRRLWEAGQYRPSEYNLIFPDWMRRGSVYVACFLGTAMTGQPLLLLAAPVIAETGIKTYLFLRHSFSNSTRANVCTLPVTSHKYHLHGPSDRLKLISRSLSIIGRLTKSQSEHDSISPDAAEKVRGYLEDIAESLPYVQAHKTGGYGRGQVTSVIEVERKYISKNGKADTKTFAELIKEKDGSISIKAHDPALQAALERRPYISQAVIPQLAAATQDNLLQPTVSRYEIEIAGIHYKGSTSALRAFSDAHARIQDINSDYTHTPTNELPIETHLAMTAVENQLELETRGKLHAFGPDGMPLGRVPLLRLGFEKNSGRNYVACVNPATTENDSIEEYITVSRELMDATPPRGIRVALPVEPEEDDAPSRKTQTRANKR